MDYSPSFEQIDKLYADARDTFHKEHVGHVYFLGSSLGYYKIGLTTNLTQRFSNFGVKLPFEVWLEEAKLYFDCAFAERFWHVTFGPERVNGEWFKLSPHHLDLFAHSLDDTQTDFKLNILYENNDWLTWDSNVMGELLKDYHNFVPYKKAAINAFYTRHEKDPGPICQYRVRKRITQDMQRGVKDEFDEPLESFDLNKPFTPEAEG